MADKKEEKKDLSIAAYIIGIFSIIFAFFNPLMGVVVSLVGLIQNKRHKGELSTKAKKLNIIGLGVSVFLLIAYFVMTILLAKYCINNPTSALCVKVLPLS